MHHTYIYRLYWTPHIPHTEYHDNEIPRPSPYCQQVRKDLLFFGHRKLAHSMMKINKEAVFDSEIYAY